MSHLITSEISKDRIVEAVVFISLVLIPSSPENGTSICLEEALLYFYPRSLSWVWCHSRLQELVPHPLDINHWKLFLQFQWVGLWWARDSLWATDCHILGHWLPLLGLPSCYNCIAVHSHFTISCRERLLNLKANSERNWTFKVEAVVKNPPANAGVAREVGLTPGSGRSLGVGSGNLLWCSCLENSMGRRAWRAVVHGAKKSHTWLSTERNWSKQWVKQSIYIW